MGAITDGVRRSARGNMRPKRAILGMFVVALVLMAALVSSPVVSAAGSGPVAYWTFDDDTTNDMVGTHHGTITGSGVTFAAGKVGRAINFSSGSSFVRIPGFNLPYLTRERLGQLRQDRLLHLHGDQELSCG